jgi:hypothetical protein
VATARALRKLEQAFQRHRCPAVCMDVLPGGCQATCQDGRCVAPPPSFDASRPR